MQSPSEGDGEAEGNDRREACLVGDIEVASPESSYRTGEQDGGDRGDGLGTPLPPEAVTSEAAAAAAENEDVGSSAPAASVPLLTSKKKGKGKARAAAAAGGGSSTGSSDPNAPSSGRDTGAVLGGEVSVGTERSDNAPGELGESAVKKGAREEAIASLVEFFRSSAGDEGGDQTGDDMDSSPVEEREHVAVAAAAAAEALASAVATAGGGDFRGSLLDSGAGVRSMGGGDVGGGEDDDNEGENDDEAENDGGEGNDEEEEDEEVVDTEGIGGPDGDLRGGRNTEDVWGSLLSASIAGGSVAAATVAASSAAASATSANREVVAKADGGIGNGERKLAGGLKAWQVAFVLEVAEGDVLSAWSRTLKHSVSALKGE